MAWPFVLAWGVSAVLITLVCFGKAQAVAYRARWIFAWNYDITHPFPEGSDRARSYNPILPQLEELTAAMREIGQAHGLSVAQVGTAWAIAKGTLLIIGVTKVQHVEDAAQAAGAVLTAEEIKRLETLADKADVSTIREWEKKME